MRLRPFAGAALALPLATPAFAGPPYATDDPEPTERGHWEVFSYAATSRVSGETESEAGFDINYGGAENLQLTLVLPYLYERADGASHKGPGDIKVAAKYRFLRQDEGGWRPDVSLFPALSLPVASRDLGSRRLGLFLPVWAQRDFGAWSVFGGGGYQFNPGPGNRDFWTGGVAVTRQVTDRLNLGAEISHRGAEDADGRAFSGVDLGLAYRLTDHWSLLASAGRGVQNARTEGRYNAYVSLRADY